MRVPSLPLAIAIVLLTATVGGLAPPASAQEGEGAYAVAGRVVSDTGEPVAGAHVSAWTYTDSGRGSRDAAQTAEDGTFALQLDAGRGTIDVWVDEWRRSESRELIVDGNVTDLDIVIVPPPPKTAIIEGIVTDANGAPIPDARIEVWQACCYAYETRAEPTPVATPTAATPPSPTSSPTPEPEPASDADGAGASPNESSACCTTSPTKVMPSRPYEYDGGASTTTDDNGYYRVATYGGPRQVTIQAPGFVQSSFQLEAVDGETVSGDATLERVPAADAVLRGRVLDAQTGLPLAHAWVNVQNVEWGRYHGVQTAEDGTFEITTIPGWIQLRVDYYGQPQPMIVEDLSDREASTADIAIKPAVLEQRYYPFVLSLRVASGEQTQDLALEPRAQPDVVLIGYVVDPEAQTGIPGATVSVWNQDTGDWGSATTDATGSYRILVRAGHYHVSSWADGYLGGAAMLTIRDDETTKRFDVQMPKGTQKYAPCYDHSEPGCGGYGREVYMTAQESEKAGSDGDDMRAETAAPMPAPTPTSPRTADLAAGGLGGDQTYVGSGGGLPPYTPPGEPQTAEGTPTEEAPANDDLPPATNDDEPPTEGVNGATTRANQKVPFGGAAVALAALGLLALALRRK